MCTYMHKHISYICTMHIHIYTLGRTDPPFLALNSCLTRLKNLKINVVFNIFIRPILHCKKKPFFQNVAYIVGLTLQNWAEIYENHFKNLQLMHVCTADAWQSGKPRVECATNARVRNFARQFWPSHAKNPPQCQLYYSAPAVALAKEQKNSRPNPPRKRVSFQSRGNGSCRMQQFVTPWICRHQTTYELIAHFRLLNFGSVAMQIWGFEEVGEGKVRAYNAYCIRMTFYTKN